VVETVSKNTERKVFVLPIELCERLRRYQADFGIDSEVEAARRLLNAGLQMRDTAETIQARLVECLRVERNIRAAARDVLADHLLVTEMAFRENRVEFKLQDGSCGAVSQDGWSTARVSR
jgi:hypothetical protein